MSTAVEMLANPAVWKAAIGSIGQSPVNMDPVTGEQRSKDVQGRETDRWVTFANYYAIELLGVAGLLAGILSLFVVGGLLAFLLSAFVMAFGILVAYQKTKLVALGDFRGQHNALRDKVDEFHQENLRLKASMDGLAVETHKLKQVEMALDTIATTTGKSTNALLDIVQENGRLQHEILEHLHGQVVMQIMTAILNTDRNQDFCLSAKEVNELVMRLHNIPGVEFHEAVFRSKIHNDQGDLTLADVCAIAHELNDSALSSTTTTSTTTAALTKAQDDDCVFSFRPHSVLEQK